MQAELEHDGDRAVLRLTTHFGHHSSIQCSKESTESFRLSFTGINDALVAQGIVKTIYDSVLVVEINGQEIRADRITNDKFDVGQIVYVVEYYNLYIENSEPGFLVSHSNIEEPRVLFVNVDCLDGGGNITKRYRVSPYTGSYRIMNNV